MITTLFVYRCLPLCKEGLDSEARQVRAQRAWQRSGLPSERDDPES